MTIEKAKQKTVQVATRTATLFKEARKTLLMIWAMALVTMIVYAIIRDGVIQLVAVQLVIGLGGILSAIALIIKSDFGSKK